MSDRTLSDLQPDQVAQAPVDQVSAAELESPNESRSTRLLRQAVESSPDRRQILSALGSLLVRTVEVPSWISSRTPGLGIGIPRLEFGLLFTVLCDYVDELEERAFATGRPAPADPLDGDAILDELAKPDPCAACGVTETRVVSGHESCASCGTSKEAPRG